MSWRGDEDDAVKDTPSQLGRQQSPTAAKSAVMAELVVAAAAQSGPRVNSAVMTVMTMKSGCSVVCKSVPDSISQ